MDNPACFRILEDIARDLSGKVPAFPTFLDLTFRIRTALKDPDLPVEQLVCLVGAEPLLSVRVIRMANSTAHNAASRPVADVRSALTRLGNQTVRSVAFAVAMQQLLRAKKMAPFADLSQRLWEHSIVVAAVCRVLARRLSAISPDEAMFAGLVHDIGAFYLLSHAADHAELFAERKEVVSLLAQWHDNIGHALLSALGQEEDLLQAVLEHERGRELTTVNSLGALVYAANAIANTRCRWFADASPGVGGEIGGEVGDDSAPFDAAVLAAVVDRATRDALVAESVEEVQVLKAGLGA